MMTRNATSKDYAIKLKQVRLELKACQEERDQLIKEREESKEEILKVLDKNRALKTELSDLDIRLERNH